MQEKLILMRYFHKSYEYLLLRFFKFDLKFAIIISLINFYVLKIDFIEYFFFIQRKEYNFIIKSKRNNCLLLFFYFLIILFDPHTKDNRPISNSNFIKKRIKISIKHLLYLLISIRNLFHIQF
jgi:hypothetical protein